MPEVVELGGVRCLAHGWRDTPLRTVDAFVDLIGEAISEEASLIVLQVAELDGNFFDLRSGFAGEVLQRAATYRLKLAIVGDVSAHTASSRAFRDFVRECNRGREVLWVREIDELEGKAATLATRSG